MSLTLTLADAAGLRWAQRQVAAHHYLHAPVDPRCSPLAYVVLVNRHSSGCLIFGRPESTVCRPLYGSLDDLDAGRVQLSRWNVINLARVWLDPLVQRGGALFVPNAATRAIGLALRRVVVDYLVARPPCFPDEPYELRLCLSYCNTALHRGTIYRAANFALVRTNRRGIQTWTRPLRRLTNPERTAVLQRSAASERGRRSRALRAAGGLQLAFEAAAR